jgi:hypothetical protein
VTGIGLPSTVIFAGGTADGGGGAGVGDAVAGPAAALDVAELDVAGLDVGAAGLLPFEQPATPVISVAAATAINS